MEEKKVSIKTLVMHRHGNRASCSAGIEGCSNVNVFNVQRIQRAILLKFNVSDKKNLLSAEEKVTIKCKFWLTYRSVIQ